MRQAEKSNFKFISMQEMSGLKCVRQNQEEANNIQQNWITMLKEDTQERQNLSSYRPRWWIGESSFCPEITQQPCCCVSMWRSTGDIKNKEIQFSQRRV